MKKLTINEELFWGLYNFIEKIDDVYTKTIFAPRTMKEVLYPDLYKFKRQYETKYQRKQFANLIDYLKRKGWITTKKLKEKKAVLITEKGREKILEIKNKMVYFKLRKRRKDGKWIMLAFDIPERKRGIRDYFRAWLLELEFQQFQKSIWISPYDVLEEIKEIIKNLGIEKNTRIFLIEETEL